MRKILSFILLGLLCSIGMVKATQTALIQGVTLPDIPTATLDLSNQTTFTADNNGWVVMVATQAIPSSIPTWFAINGSRSTQSPQSSFVAANSSTTAPFVDCSSGLKINKYSPDAAIRFTGAEKASFLVSARSTSQNKEMYIALFTYDSQADPMQVQVGSTLVTSSKDPQELLFSNLEDDNTYIAYIYGGSSGQNGSLLEIALKGKSGPSITTQPVGGNYVTGNVSALTVAATASDGDLEYQWYSCDDANKTNASAIDGATNASYTPTAAGFYYVTVTDDNGSVDSDVAQITISAAAAPTINVTGAPNSAVLIGTEVTLTATATGTPTPTIKWYDGTDTEVGTDATYSPSTAAAGTYTFYAVASNGVEPNATSAVQTIIVKEKVATPTIAPNGAFFITSQEVTIACETNGATIKYSTDGGNTWNDYTEALNLSVTTTINAKATKEGCIDSEVATATFTKKADPHAWREVSSSEIWDWSTSTGANVNLTNETSPQKDSDDDIVAADFDGQVYEYNCGFPSNFDAIVMNKFQRPKNGSYYQGQTLKINTSVSGVLTVTFANTGSKRPNRYLSVNGTIYGEGSGAGSSAAQRTVSIPVEAGIIVMTGIYEPDKSNYTQGEGYSAFEDNKAGTAQYLNYYKVEFSAGHPFTAADDNFYGLYLTSAVNIPDGVEAYTGTLNGAETYLTITQVEGSVIPANTPVLVKADAAGLYNFTYSNNSDAAIVSSLKGVAEATTVVSIEAANTGKTCLTLGLDGEGVIGFRKPIGSSIAANKVYLLVNTPDSEVPAPSIRIVMGENNTTDINSLEASEKAQKFFENGNLYILRDGVVYDATGRVVR